VTEGTGGAGPRAPALAAPALRLRAPAQGSLGPYDRRPQPADDERAVSERPDSVADTPAVRARRLRRAEDDLLVIEVSEETVRLDLGRKARIYAAAGVPEYWVVDDGREVVHVRTDPAPDGQHAAGPG
jgi:hypothetical protein